MKGRDREESATAVAQGGRSTGVREGRDWSRRRGKRRNEKKRRERVDWSRRRSGRTNKRQEGRLESAVAGDGGHLSRRMVR